MPLCCAAHETLPVAEPEPGLAVSQAALLLTVQPQGLVLVVTVRLLPPPVAGTDALLDDRP